MLFILRVSDSYFSGGDFSIIGDFSAEENGMVPDNDRRRLASTSLVIRGLLDSNCELQVKTSKEYSEKPAFYDRITLAIQDLRDRHRLFNQWKSASLRKWQFDILQSLMRQNDRKILWVVDKIGNRGKTFLCMYLNILYNFQYLDGTINCRDLAGLLDRNVMGVVFDVCRAAHQQFDYCALESLKNGIILSGKYRGKCMRFSSMKVAVFSNSFPSNSNLSEDRWTIVTLDENTASSNLSTISPSNAFPFSHPPALPDLSENFDLRTFLEARVCQDEDLLDNHAQTQQLLMPAPFQQPPPPPFLQPQAPSSQPQAHSSQPHSSYLQHQAHSSQPNSSYLQPQAHSSQPNSSYLQPQAHSSQPHAQSSQPQAQSSQPQANSSQHRAHSLPPQTHSSQPHSSYLQPQAHSSQPQANSSQPQANSSQPQANSLQPQAPSSQFQIPSSQLTAISSQAPTPSFRSPTVPSQSANASELQPSFFQQSVFFEDARLQQPSTSCCISQDIFRTVESSVIVGSVYQFNGKCDS